MDRKYKIFLVDDDPIFLDILTETLNDDIRYEILCFSSGEEALKELSTKPDIVVLDYYLNSQDSEAKNGMQILKELKKESNDIEVIILSGQEDGKLVYDLTLEQASDYVIKDEDAFDNIQKAIEDIIMEAR